MHPRDRGLPVPDRSDCKLHVRASAWAGQQVSGRYSQSTLRTWAERIENWRKELKHVFVYFDNDQAGFAAMNALELRRMVEDY